MAKNPTLKWSECDATIDAATLNVAPGITATHRWNLDATRRMNIKLFLCLCHSLWQLANSALIPSFIKKWSLFPDLWIRADLFWATEVRATLQFLGKTWSSHRNAPSENPAAMLWGSPRWPLESERPTPPLWCSSLSPVAPAGATCYRDEPSPPSSAQLAGLCASDWHWLFQAAKFWSGLLGNNT